MACSNRERIKQIDEILQSGATTVTVDGISTTFDLDMLAKLRAQLAAEDEFEKARRPAVSTIRLDRAF